MIGIIIERTPLAGKLCTACRAAYSLAGFLALPPPASGIGVAHAMAWRNCRCGGTLTVLLSDLSPLQVAMATKGAQCRCFRSTGLHPDLAPCASECPAVFTTEEN